MTKSSLKKLKKKEEDKKKNITKSQKFLNIAFNILAVFCLIIFGASLVQKGFQNDTFYTIKIGQLIRTNGIDYLDHFAWHDNLPYMYPHWLYDVIISVIYDYLGGFTGIYISTIVLSSILAVTLYFTNKKISKNPVIAFVIAVGQMYLMREYIAARAQLVTFILFVLTILFIEKFLQKPKKRYAAVLIIIPIIIANIHSAVFPFYFILYLPYLAEYALIQVMDWHIVHKIYNLYLKIAINIANKRLKKANKNDTAEKYKEQLVRYNKRQEASKIQFEKFLIKQTERSKKPYKIKLEKNDNVRKLFIIMVVCILTGLLTPIKDMPYTYTWKIMQGNTTKNISEHLPLTLINYKAILITLSVTIGLISFTKIKIRCRDLLFLGGLTLLALMSRRQVSMLVLFGGFALNRILAELIYIYDKRGTNEFMQFATTIFGQILVILFIMSLSYLTYRPNFNAEYISESYYPIKAASWIKENLDYKNVKIFNDYNYGSYLLFEDIPVFIDSRCDLYTPEFNGEYDKKEKKYDGQDIFSDYISISGIDTYYDSKFQEYEIDYIITKSNSKLSMLITKDNGYKQIYKDKYFVIYERLKEIVT